MVKIWQRMCVEGITAECKSTRQGALSVRAQGQGFSISRNVNAMQ